MTSTTPEGAARRARWLAVIGAIAVTTLTVLVTATSTAASGESTTTEESSTSSTVEDEDDDDTSTSSEASSSSEVSTSTDSSTSSTPATAATGTGATTAPAGTGVTASSSEFTANLEAECAGDTGHPLLADALEAAVGSDGSTRIVEILRTCDVEFVGAPDQALGRPATNVEALIADPVNNVTPNQAQRELLDAELAIYWRIADAWASANLPAQAGASTTSAVTSDVSSTDVTTSEVPTSAPGAPSTTTG